MTLSVATDDVPSKLKPVRRALAVDEQQRCCGTRGDRFI